MFIETSKFSNFLKFHLDHYTQVDWFFMSNVLFLFLWIRNKIKKSFFDVLLNNALRINLQSWQVLSGFNAGRERNINYNKSSSVLNQIIWTDLKQTFIYTYIENMGRKTSYKTSFVRNTRESWMPGDILRKRNILYDKIVV